MKYIILKGKKKAFGDIPKAFNIMITIYGFITVKWKSVCVFAPANV